MKLYDMLSKDIAAGSSDLHIERLEEERAGAANALGHIELKMLTAWMRVAQVHDETEDLEIKSELAEIESMMKDAMGSLEVDEAEMAIATDPANQLNWLTYVRDTSKEVIGLVTRVRSLRG